MNSKVWEKKGYGHFPFNQNFWWGSKWNRHFFRISFRNFGCTMQGWPRILENQNNQKILFQLTIPAYAQFCRAEKSNSTWLILKLLNISTLHDLYLTVDLNLLLQHYCTGLATTSFSN